MNEQPPSDVVVGEIDSHWEAVLEEMHLPDVRRAAALIAWPTLCAARPADVILLIAVLPSSIDPANIKNLRQQDAAQGRYTCMVQCISADQINVVPMQLIAGTDDILLHSVDVRGLSRRLALFGRIAALETQLLHFKRQVPPNELLLQDRLTGLGNWRYLTNHLENLLHETRDRGGLVCCALLSVDRLDYITKHYGQAVRSELLRGIAMRLRKTLRLLVVVVCFCVFVFGVVLCFFVFVFVCLWIFVRLLRAISYPAFTLAREEMEITVSLGVCCSDGKGEISPFVLFVFVGCLLCVVFVVGGFLVLLCFFCVLVCVSCFCGF